MSVKTRRKLNLSSDRFVITAVEQPKIMSIIYTKGWSASPNGITKQECQRVTNSQLGNTFQGAYVAPAGYTDMPEDKEDFSGFKYFTGVTQINQSAFSNNKWIGKIILPNTITTIGVSAFRDMNLNGSNFIIPSSVRTVGSSAFMYSFCDNLIIQPGIQSIGGSAFQYFFHSTDELVIPDTVTSMGNYAFSNNNLFKKLIFSPNCTTVPSSGFVTCTSLKEIIIPEGVERIESLAFNNYAFDYAILPSTITFIGNRAFWDRPHDYMIIRAVEPPLLNPRPNTTTYQNFSTSYIFPIYVPDESVEAYKTATGWAVFANYIRPLSQFTSN